MADRSLQINTMPIAKLTVLLNDFIVKTVNHLDKLSTNVEEKFQNFDKKFNDLDAMTSLLESKLNSLPPEITANYPQLMQCNLDDVNPVVSVSPVIIPPQQSQGNQAQSDNNANVNQQEEKKEEEEKVEDEKVEEEKELTPEEELEEFMKEHDNETFKNLQKMLKLKIPEQALMQKAMMNGLNIDDVQKLADLWKKAHPY